MWNSIEQAEKQVIASFDLAHKCKSKLTDDILNMEGMTGQKTRHFYNNLLNTVNKLNYMEIGVWRGSSFISAMYNNMNVVGLAVDDFNPHYGGFNCGIENYNLFLQNAKQYLVNQEKYNVAITEFYEIDVNSLPKADVYLYDGDHIEHFQYNAFKRMFDAFADICVVIIDDYNDKSVQSGTQKAIAEFGKEIPFRIYKDYKIMYTLDGSHTPLDIAKKEFWNGMYVCILERLK